MANILNTKSFILSSVKDGIKTVQTSVQKQAVTFTKKKKCATCGKK